MNSEKKNDVVKDSTVPVDNNDKIHVKEREVKELPDFDIEFIQNVLAQEGMKFKKNDYIINKVFLLTGIKEKEDTNSQLEVFVYEISPEENKNELLSLFEKLTQKKDIKIIPETKAPHTCYLFSNKGKLYIWGYYGMYSYYEPFDESFFMSYIKNQLFQ
jgi:formate dehydrogenase assembly factor FdhD